MSQKSNDHILEAYVYINVKDEVSVANYMDRRAKKEKYQNVSHLKTVSLYLLAANKESTKMSVIYKL